MVISSVILYTTRVYGNFKILNFVLDNCKIYSNEILIGWLCGFVIGAKGICEKYKLYKDNKSFNRSVFLCSNAGIGFVVGCVGGVIWKSIWFGIYLYTAQILSAISLFKIQGKDTANFHSEAFDTPIPFFSAAVKAIKTSTSSIITICGFNVFFSALCDLINMQLGLKMGDLMFSINTIIMDFSRGSFCSMQSNSLLISSFLTGFCVGFGGLCVHLQIYAECEGYPLNRIKFTIFKLLQGLLCGILAMFYTFI